MTTADKANDTAQAAQLNGNGRTVRQTIYHRQTATRRARTARTAAGTGTASENTETAKPDQSTEN